MWFMKRPESGIGLAAGMCSRRVWVHKAPSGHWWAIFQHSRPWLIKDEHHFNKKLLLRYYIMIVLRNQMLHLQYNQEQPCISLCVLLWKSNSICTHAPLCCQEVCIREVLAGSCYILHIRKEVRVVLMQVKVEEFPRHMGTFNDNLRKISQSKDC